MTSIIIYRAYASYCLICFDTNFTQIILIKILYSIYTKFLLFIYRHRLKSFNDITLFFQFLFLISRQLF